MLSKVYRTIWDDAYKTACNVSFLISFVDAFGEHWITIDGKKIKITDAEIQSGHIKQAIQDFKLNPTAAGILNKAHKQGIIKTDRHLFHTIGIAKANLLAKKFQGPEGAGMGSHSVKEALNHVTGEKLEQSAAGGNAHLQAMHGHFQKMISQDDPGAGAGVAPQGQGKVSPPAGWDEETGHGDNVFKKTIGNKTYFIKENEYGEWGASDGTVHGSPEEAAEHIKNEYEKPASTPINLPAGWKATSSGQSDTYSADINGIHVVAKKNADGEWITSKGGLFKTPEEAFAHAEQATKGGSGTVLTAAEIPSGWSKHSNINAYVNGKDGDEKKVVKQNSSGKWIVFSGQPPVSTAKHFDTAKEAFTSADEQAKQNVDIPTNWKESIVSKGSYDLVGKDYMALVTKLKSGEYQTSYWDSKASTKLEGVAEDKYSTLKEALDSANQSMQNLDPESTVASDILDSFQKSAKSGLNFALKTGSASQIKKQTANGKWSASVLTKDGQKATKDVDSLSGAMSFVLKAQSQHGTPEEVDPPSGWTKGDLVNSFHADTHSPAYDDVMINQTHSGLWQVKAYHADDPVYPDKQVFSSANDAFNYATVTGAKDYKDNDGYKVNSDGNLVHQKGGKDFGISNPAGSHWDDISTPDNPAYVAYGSDTKSGATVSIMYDKDTGKWTVGGLDKTNGLLPKKEFDTHDEAYKVANELAGESQPAQSTQPKYTVDPNSGILQEVNGVKTPIPAPQGNGWKSGLFGSYKSDTSESPNGHKVIIGYSENVNKFFVNDTDANDNFNQEFFDNHEEAYDAANIAAGYTKSTAAQQTAKPQYEVNPNGGMIQTVNGVQTPVPPPPGNSWIKSESGYTLYPANSLSGVKVITGYASNTGKWYVSTGDKSGAAQASKFYDTHEEAYKAASESTGFTNPQAQAQPKPTVTPQPTTSPTVTPGQPQGSQTPPTGQIPGTGHVTVDGKVLSHDNNPVVASDVTKLHDDGVTMSDKALESFKTAVNNSQIKTDTELHQAVAIAKAATAANTSYSKITGMSADYGIDAMAKGGITALKGKAESGDSDAQKVVDNLGKSSYLSDKEKSDAEIHNLTQDDLVKVGGPGGSNEGGFYNSKHTGNKYYVKYYKDAEQVHSENTANGIYNSLGLNAPQSVPMAHNGEEGSGKLAYVSKILPSQGELGKVGINKEKAKKALDGFAADILLSNWDAAGMTHDNMLVDHNDNIIRVDNGGALTYRAQGGKKSDDQLSKIDEWNNLAPGGINKQYEQLFAKAGYAKPEDIPGIKKQISDIEKLRDSHGGWDNYLKQTNPTMSDSQRASVASLLDTRTNLLSAKKADIQGFKSLVGKRKFEYVAEPTKGETHLYSQVVDKHKAHEFQSHTAGEVSAISSFKSSGYSAMNSLLRENKPLTGHTATQIKALDKMFARKENKLGVDRQLSRKVGLYGKDLDVYTKALEGDIIIDSGIQSHSTDSKVWGGNVHFRAYVPAEHPAVNPSVYTSANYGEKEIVLPRGTKYRILGSTAPGAPTKNKGDDWEWHTGAWQITVEAVVDGVND